MSTVSVQQGTEERKLRFVLRELRCAVLDALEEGDLRGHLVGWWQVITTEDPESVRYMPTEAGARALVRREPS